MMQWQVSSLRQNQIKFLIPTTILHTRMYALELLEPVLIKSHPSVKMNSCFLWLSSLIKKYANCFHILGQMNWTITEVKFHKSFIWNIT